MWSSLHCIEKYSKCILLFSGYPIIPYKHDIKNIIKYITETIKLDFEFDNSEEDFLERLDSCGFDRYGTKRRHQKFLDGIFFDSLIRKIRAYCLPHDHDDLVIYLSSVSSSLHKYEWRFSPLERGYLEKVEQDKNSSNNMRRKQFRALSYKNCHFGDRQKKKIRLDMVQASICPRHILMTDDEKDFFAKLNIPIGNQEDRSLFLKKYVKLSK